MNTGLVNNFGLAITGRTPDRPATQTGKEPAMMLVYTMGGGMGQFPTNFPLIKSYIPCTVEAARRVGSSQGRDNMVTEEYLCVDSSDDVYCYLGERVSLPCITRCFS
jgi:hypothetical protein